MMLNFILIGPNPLFRQIESRGESLRDVIVENKADIVRQTIGFPEPLFSMELFKIDIWINRLLLEVSTAAAADRDTAVFSIDISVAQAAFVANPSAPELSWFRKRATESVIKRTFMVYGDDPNEPGGSLLL